MSAGYEDSDTTMSEGSQASLLGLPGGNAPSFAPFHHQLIPPELRNMSYAHLSREVETHCATTVSVVHQTSLHDPAASTWTNQLRSDLALTQSCRQLRAEYLPLYIQHTVIFIFVRKFIEYTKNTDTSIPPVFPSRTVAIGLPPLPSRTDRLFQPAIDTIPSSQRILESRSTIYLGYTVTNALVSMSSLDRERAWFPEHGKWLK